MKILQVITSLRMGGAEKLVADMIPLFVQEGHKVDLLLFDGVETPLLKMLQSSAVRIIKYNSGGNPYNPLLIEKIRKLIPKYDIIHTHNTSCQYFVAFAKSMCNCHNVKFITTEHNTTNRRRTIWGFKWLDRWMYKQYDQIVSISDKATENLLNFIGKDFCVNTIYNGINLRKFVSASCLNGDKVLRKNGSDFVLCMVAGFRVQKDQDTIIKALNYVPQNVKLWLIGEGIRKTECEQLVEKYRLDSRVVFAGIRTDIPQILKTADVIIMSSHWEGLSLSSIEGMSAGKPFVASDVDGLHEIVENYGLLFPHGDAKRLSEIILQLMSQPDYADGIAQKCYEKAMQYDIQTTVDRYLALYASLIGK